MMDVHHMMRVHHMMDDDGTSTKALDLRQYIACPFPFLQSELKSLAPFGKEV